jgi:hypothetical protein
MKRPHLPQWFYGVVPARVPKINVWLGLAGIVLCYTGMFTGSWLALSIGVGTVSVMPIGVGVQWLYQWRFNRKVAHWPVHVQVMPDGEGGRVAFVTTHDGEVSSLVLPEGYDPSDDDGRWFMQQIAPDLAALMEEEEEDDAD